MKGKLICKYVCLFGGIILLLGLLEEISAQSIFLTTTKDGVNISDNSNSILPLVNSSVAPDSYTWVKEEAASLKYLIADAYKMHLPIKCNSISTKTINLKEIKELTLNIKSENSTSEYCNGSIKLEVDGGKAPYNYLWHVNTSVAGFINTTFKSNNGSGGIMFDLKAINAIAINGLDVNLNSGNTKVDIYYRSGSYEGFENDKNKWTKEGTYNIKSEGAGNPTHISLRTMVSAGAGETISFFISSHNSGLKYSTGTFAGSILASDNNVEIFEGIGRGSNLFNSVIFSDRKFSGRVYYITNGNSISKVKNLKNLCEGMYTVIVSDANGNSASSSCTINLEDNLGAFYSYDNIESAIVKFNESTSNTTPRFASGENSVGELNCMVAYPNPSNGNVILRFESDEVIHAEILLLDLTGRTLLNKEVVLDRGFNELVLNLTPLPIGVYMLKGIWGNTFNTIRLVIN